MINKLSEKYPEISKEWHPSKNGKTTPEDVSAGSSKKAWWLCSEGHTFEQRIRYHVTSKKCPVCSGRQVREETSLKALYPEIANEWHPTKNGSLFPTDVRPGSEKKVYWQCPNFDHHIYFSKISQRTRNKSSCPHCRRRQKIYTRSLMFLHPELLKDWDYEKNDITADTISAKSEKKVWWICRTDPSHSHQTKVYDYVINEKCRICFPISHIPNSMPTLNVANPELLKEWDYSKNKLLDPTIITAGSNKYAWWICSICSHKWKASILNRFRGGRGCPKCANNYKTIENTLASKFPEIAEEWDYKKNKDFTPETISYGSGRRVWWICKKNKSHSWEATVKERTKNNPNICPHCRGVKKSILTTDYPEIAAEWHPTKNGNLNPSTLASKSNKKVWWQCNKNPNHEWDAVIKNRTILNSGCPICHKERADISTTDELFDSILSSTETFQNYKTGIDSITKLLKIKVWDRKLNRAFRKMIYANIITLMETYLSDTFIKKVFNDPELLRKFIESNPKYQKEKIEISNIFKWTDNVKENIRDELIDITYHNIWKVQKMYKDVLDIIFPEKLVDVQEVIMLRHHIVHRNGKTKEGKSIRITKVEINYAIELINKFILSIEEQYTDKFVNN
jgi:Probable Zinc-ribbon domain